MSYAAFWLHYLRAHDREGTRALHYIGSAAAVIVLLAAVMTRQWWLLPCAVVIGYAFAWTGHFVVERNRPATFGHPFWSLFSDFRMLLLWSSGRLQPHLVRARQDAA